MATKIFAAVAKSYLPENVLGQESPYYVYTAEGDGNGHLNKRQRKPPPAGLTNKEKEVLKTVKRKAYRLDEQMLCCCCNVRAGWSSVVGIIPFIGAILNLLLSRNVIAAASRVELPKWVLAQMYANVTADFAMAMVPIVGDLMVMFFRCNTRNCILLEQTLKARGIERLRRNPNFDADQDALLPKHPWYKFWSAEEPQSPHPYDTAIERPMVKNDNLSDHTSYPEARLIPAAKSDTSNAVRRK